MFDKRVSCSYKSPRPSVDDAQARTVVTFTREKMVSFHRHTLQSVNQMNNQVDYIEPTNLVRHVRVRNQQLYYLSDLLRLAKAAYRNKILSWHYNQMSNEWRRSALHTRCAGVGSLNMTVLATRAGATALQVCHGKPAQHEANCYNRGTYNSLFTVLSGDPVHDAV